MLITPLLMPNTTPPQCIEPLGTINTEGKIEPKIKVIQWGLGFSEVHKERRPMYPALPPGTIVKITNNCLTNNWPTTGYLHQLGYGALINLPTT
jgi:CRISPR/Cas system-associated protein Csx1